MKKCSSCNDEKTYHLFHKNSRSKDGLRSDCKSCRKEYTKRYNESRRDSINERQREYNKRPEVRERHIDRCRKYYEKNRDSISKRVRAWDLENIEKVRLIKREAQKRYLKDYVNAEKHRMRSRLAMAISSNGLSKKSKTEDMLGCDWGYFVGHIESQFLPGMSWNNREEWHIDHIIPLSSARTIEELQELAHYTNTRPLWASDNLRKGAKIDYSAN